MSAVGKSRLVRLARCDERIAELQAQLAQEHATRAAVAREIAGDEPIDIATGNRLPARHEPTIPEPSEVDRARARKVLQLNRTKRKVRP